MRIFLAGGSGAIGRQLIPLLVAEGHSVAATTRRTERLAQIERQGATPINLDVLDRDAVIDAVRAAKPDAIIHQLTDLSGPSMEGNAPLRIYGTRNLVDAAQANGIERMVAQSIAWVIEPGDGIADEATPLDSDPAAPDAATVAGVRALENAVAELDSGVVLRYGLLYGPGTWYSRDGANGRAAIAGTLPATNALASFVHVRDAARAAVAALDWPAGIVNIVDGDPAPGTEWVPVFAEALGGPPPPFEDGPSSGRPISNARAISLGFALDYPSWRIGFLTL